MNVAVAIRRISDSGAVAVVAARISTIGDVGGVQPVRHPGHGRVEIRAHDPGLVV
jgi:hypothetical protein